MYCHPVGKDHVLQMARIEIPSLRAMKTINKKYMIVNNEGCTIGCLLPDL